ncbi:MAG: triose-phosphate isomerase [Candidatus Doudnabacteria bacterium]|nr:triose-phosphate isomerase [Candidatus Doudnabacteria bacterium]
MKKLIIANWKMNPETIADARALALSIEHRMHTIHITTDVVVCPPSIYLPPFSHYLHLAKLGAQNVSWAESGAYTGEISAKQLTQWGIEYIILGHSERRIYFHENDKDVNLKIKMALKNKIHPIVCLGGEAGAKKTDMNKLVIKQLNAVTKDLTKDEIFKIIFAYEPVWAISTMKNSRPATGDHAVELIEHIQTALGRKVGIERSKNMRILYGGTVTKSNVNEFAKHPMIDGALVGGASLDADNFWEIVREFSRESIHKEEMK